MKIDGVDQQTPLKVVEGDITYEVLDQHFEGFAAVESRSEQTAEGDVGPGDLKNVPPSDQAGSSFHLPSGYAGGPCSRDQGADTGTYYKARNQRPFFEGA
jgi:hypothetical protein